MVLASADGSRRKSQKRVSPDQTTSFGGPPQAELFGAPAKLAYVPDPRHVRNRLADLLGKLKAAERWPWEPVIVRLHRDRNVPYLCDLLADRDEAEHWRAEFAAEIVRLERAEAASPAMFATGF